MLNINQRLLVDVGKVKSCWMLEVKRKLLCDKNKNETELGNKLNKKLIDSLPIGKNECGGGRVRTAGAQAQPERPPPGW